MFNILKRLKNHIMIILVIILNVYLFKDNIKSNKEIKKLEAEQAKLIRKESQMLNDVINRSEELKTKNEELIYYIQTLEAEKETDRCLSSPINDNVRRLLYEAGI